MTLREQIHADVAGVFLNTEDFGESFWYCPKDGTKRRIVGVAEAERTEVIESPHGKQNRHTLELFCSRDSTTGIDDPQLGDGLWRVSTDEDQGFSFAGLANDRDENDGTADAGQGNAHSLLFIRYTPYKIGGTRQR